MHQADLGGTNGQGVLHILFSYKNYTFELTEKKVRSHCHLPQKDVSWPGFSTDLDDWINHYNEERPHSGRYCFGKTPMQTFMESRNLAVEKMLNKALEVVEII